MLTSAITAGIAAVLHFLGITPGPGLVAGIWIAVKIIIVSLIAFATWRVAKKKQAKEKQPPTQG